MTKKLLMIAFPAILATMMLLGSVTGASLNQEVFAVKGGNEKVDICHNTSSEKNPQVTINVSVNAIPAHLSHGDFVGTCEDGPDCAHESNAESPECVVSCPDCEAEYEAEVAQCDPPNDEGCLKEAKIALDDCLAKNEKNPECTVPCPDCDAEWEAALLECNGEKACTLEANGIHEDCLISNEENPECTDPCVDCQDAYAADVDVCLADGYDQDCLDRALDDFQECLLTNDVEPNSCQVTPPPTPCEDCQAAYEANVDACIGDEKIFECLENALKSFEECKVENGTESSCQVDPQPVTCEGCKAAYEADISNCVGTDLSCYREASAKFEHCLEIISVEPSVCRL